MKNLKPATEALIGSLQELLGPQGWVSGTADTGPYVSEWRGLYTGSTPLVVKPANTLEVSSVLALCNEHCVGVVPQGGHTGLAGGAIPGLEDKAEIVLSLERMNTIRSIDADNFTVTVEAGCVLANLQQAVTDAGRFFPLSLASEGSCQIGGNISTNAGGTAVLRYGNTRDLVLGLEVVLSDGRVLSNLNGVRKDNTGYDLKQLFVGAEGTLGVVTAATLKLFPAPRGTATALLAVADPGAIVRLFSGARDALGDEILAFETFPHIAMEMVEEHLPGHRSPLDAAYPWYVLIETAGQLSQALIDQHMLSFLEAGIESGLLTDGVLAQSEAQRAEIWKLRHGISEAQKLAGASIKHDVSVPVSVIPDFIARASDAVAQRLPGIRPVPFGHVGDGNIHFNLSQPEAMESGEFLDLWEEMNDLVHSLAVEMGGSFSAEHGIGYLKRDEMQRLSDPVDLDLMRAIKHALDPQGIMNPGKLLLP